ncbi:ring finger protein [Cercophora newfieldiana]|uniref:Ring finger protein n=1 Tax=Cercophora newfieldiana TaxID=92897 RepID=A0AA39XWS7_9PEZI|nr:ring finger protein [Cercophora newfieldiana]
MDERWPACEEAVLAVFPDMCLQHLKQLGTQYSMDHEQIILHVIDQQDAGRPYPTWEKTAKRKRPDASPEAEGPAKRIKFDEDRDRLTGKDYVFIKTYTKAARTLLVAQFPELYVQDIEKALKENGNLLYPSFFSLERMLDNTRKGVGPLLKLKTKPRANPPDDMFSKSQSEAVVMAHTEYNAAKTKSQERKAKVTAELQQEQEELQNLNRAVAEGTVADCECCFNELPLNRMVHCEGQFLHWFCRECAKHMADTQIGLSKYELTCMSMDGCEAGFSLDQRSLFLDAKTTVALERIEQEAVLRMAGLENLAKCPFCPYAAEYPPVEENKEFRCENPTCGIVSCRLCDLETHIPKTCREVKAEEGHSARHRIEEAMSTALIRKCNKCKTSFIKEHGCNKMTCSAPGCKNVQCYVCSESCDYAHFDDPARGGKKGQCPLFDSVETRHEEEVKAAELRERQRVAEENPDVDGDFFNINFSDKVKEDDNRRKARNPGPDNWQYLPPAAPAPPHHLRAHPQFPEAVNSE